MFVICDPGSLVPNIGKLSTKNFLRLQATCNTIIKMAKSIEHPASLKQEIHSYSDVLTLFLDCLKHLPMNFEQVCLSIRETQHVACLLHAMANYMLIYKPCMKGHAVQEVVRTVCDSYLMGAFVHDATTLQHFCQAGIPVWFFRPLEELALYQIDAVGELWTL